MKEKSISQAFVWKMMERCGVYGAQFVLQILLARLLDPELYGVLSLMVVFTTLANVFIQRGFNTALVQNKDVTDDDYSSVFWITLGIAIIAYGVLFFSAPVIASFYEMPEFTKPFRVLALILIPGAFNSVQIARVNRELDFKKIFTSNIAAVVLSGVAGIAIALMGGGLWALVMQNLLNVLVACLVMRFTVHWTPGFVINFSRIRVLFSFGWKLLVSSLLDTLYQDLRSLVIGKKYSSETLGYYSRGKQFPHYIINMINGTIQSVMLPAMSRKQDSLKELKDMMRRSILLSSYIVFPMMAGLAAVSNQVVHLLLTEKWLPCVPYMIVYCCTQAFYPVHSCNLQALNAMGRSDQFLKLEVIKKIFGIIILVIAIVCFDTPMAIALSGLLSTWVNWAINASPNKKLLKYSYGEQLGDVLPQLLLSVVMGIIVYSVGLLGLNDWLLLLIQIPLGVLIYVLGSKVFHLEGFDYIWSMIRKLTKKRGLQ